MIRNTNIWKRVLTILTTGVLGITTVSFPNLTVKNYAARLLTEGTDYTISYKNNTNAGRAAIVITGKGLYGADQGDHLKEVDFYIDPADISGEDIRTSPVNEQYKTRNNDCNL